MATPKRQRIGIWVIATVMIIGTIGSFAVMILANQNNASSAQQIQQEASAYQTAYTAYQAKVTAQTTALSTQYYSEFNSYASIPAAFTAADVTSLTSNDLKVGTGATLTKTSNFTAYYFGWLPTGKVFDSSISDGALKAPLAVSPGGVISGWTDGVVGMKVGGVRELTIPSADAYGSTGSSTTIPPNTPLKFVIMVIPTPAGITQPAMSQELANYYAQANSSPSNP